MFAFIVTTSVLLGLAVGSFLNVVIYRVPAGRSVVSPGSACPECSVAIGPRDNIPIVSWLLLRGRCRNCGASISVRYPFVEALAAVVFGLIAARLGASWSLPAELAFAAGLLALAAVDLERYLLPRAILYPTVAIVGVLLLVAAIATGEWRKLGIAAVCSAGAFAFFFAINFIRPSWMGFGDVRLAGLIGAALGWLSPWHLLIGFMIANLAGAVLGIALMISGRATRRTALPYGVFLAVGSILAILVGAPIVHWYHAHLIH